MTAFGICYIAMDGLSVASMTAFEADDLAEALILARTDSERPARGSYSDIQIWSDGCLIFCGDPDKAGHRDAPSARCSTGLGASQLVG